MNDVLKKLLMAALTFFLAALLLYIGACYLVRVWWVLAVAAAIAITVLIYIRFFKKPKY